MGSQTPTPPPDAPAEPTLVDDIEPPATAPEAKPKAKRQTGKAETPPAAGSGPPAPPAGPPTVEQVEVLLRKHGRSWADVAARLDELGEYYPADLELHGLTGPQLNLAADWLAMQA